MCDWLVSVRASARGPIGLMALLLATLLLLPAAAESQTASVRGIVSDVQGLPLPGVTVVLRSETGQFVASAITNRNGDFAFPQVSGGAYLVEATLLGFTPSETPVNANSNAPIAIMLEVGTFAQEVTVSALMPELATEMVLPASEIERRVAQDLASRFAWSGGLMRSPGAPARLARFRQRLSSRRSGRGNSASADGSGPTTAVTARRVTASRACGGAVTVSGSHSSATAGPAATTPMAMATRCRVTTSRSIPAGMSARASGRRR